MELFPLNFSL